MTTAKQYDLANRLASVSSVNAKSSPLGSFGYTYNDANQRTRATLVDGSYWLYSYDKLGQVTSGNKYWSDGTPVTGQQFDYAFDDIGNRGKTGGRASAVSDYTANALNQYTSRTVPGAVDVLGIANPTANVTVNSIVANRRGEYFHWPLAVNNASAAQYPTVTVVSQYGSTQTDSGEVFVPSATESYSYDSDGNLTADGRWTYTWDAENRLIEMKRDTDSPSGARQKLVFEYDHQGRRIRKQFYTYSGGWQQQDDIIMLYDGWNLIGELNANNSNSKLRTYIWGLDLSGSEQGAGGVGGLLKLTDYTGSTTHHFVGYDGNGNVAALIDAGTGALTARYEYGPFGEPLRTTGTMAKKCPFRFSTKFTDNESALLHYGYRYYNPSIGRWLSRDPIEEWGGPNLYSFALDAPTRAIDTDGLQILILDPVIPPILIEAPPFGFRPGLPTEFFPARPGPIELPPARPIFPLPQPPGSTMPPLYPPVPIVPPQIPPSGGPNPSPNPNPIQVPVAPPSNNPVNAPPNSLCSRKRCKPCIPPVGTIAGRVDPGGGHGTTGPYHLHYAEMNRVPVNTPPPARECSCFWDMNSKDPVNWPYPTLPPGMPPVIPAGGGGVEYY